MRTRLFAITVCLAIGLSAAAPAEAQYGARSATSNRATGETYHFELGAAFWNPSPDIVISSEQFGQIGSNIDFVQTLGHDLLFLNRLSPFQSNFQRLRSGP